MKFRNLLILIPIITAVLFIATSFSYAKNTNGNDGKKLQKNKNTPVKVVKNYNANPAKVVKNNNGNPAKFVKNNKGNPAKFVKNNNGNINKHIYTYQGHYKNFKNNNHLNRYYYKGKYYNFKNYYTYYSRDNNAFYYQGGYARHGNIFVFTDAYGNEFDTYLKPVYRSPGWLVGRSLEAGNSYKIRMTPARVYPGSYELSLGKSLPFGWGNLTLQNDRYYDMYTTPHLVNVNGRLYRM
jgi:hypothetical protein